MGGAADDSCWHRATVELQCHRCQVAGTITGSTLTLEWSLSERVDQRDVPYTVAITLFLPAGARTAEIRASVAKPDPFNEARLGLWAITLTVGMIAASADDEVFTPTGLGVSLRGAVEGQKYLGRYPGSSSTLQFLAVGGGTTSDGCGVYFGAHDPHARAKWLSWTVTNSTGDAAGVVAAAEVADESAECLQRGICGGTAATSNLHGGATRVHTSTDGFGCSGHRCSCPLMSPAAFSPAKARGPARFHTLGMSYVVEGAGGLSTYKLPFPLALGVTPSHVAPCGTRRLSSIASGRSRRVAPLGSPRPQPASQSDRTRSRRGSSRPMYG